MHVYGIRPEIYILGDHNCVHNDNHYAATEEIERNFETNNNTADR